MRRVTVLQWQRAVRLHRGVLAGELGAGRHRLRLGETVRLVDTRAQSLVLTGQDVPTADQILIRATVVLTWRVVDATAFLCATVDPGAELHLAVQSALRTAVATRPHDAVDAARAEVGAEIAVAVADRAGELGVDVREATLRDVVLPAELRRAALAELVAQREGRAMLERARAETAAIRSLLNAAKLAEEHPALLQLRTLQLAAESGSTVILERPR